MLDFSLEAESGFICAGVDEAGRGPLAGPVVAGAVILPPALVDSGELQGINDSKKLSAARRRFFADILWRSAFCSLGFASVSEIDSLNILQATFLAMLRAVGGLSESPELILVDGNMSPDFGIASRYLVGGDGYCLSVAAASVIAKHSRDSLMSDLASAYPQYGWASNKGYGTAAHRRAISEHGLTEHHRASFCRNIKTIGEAEESE